ncbi:hypothetical protein FJZ33_06205 [Candidatus Poribacteria bacterium]|nr:hypothetical protein [Candidatus Poribacteria bacterium]
MSTQDACSTLTIGLNLVGQYLTHKPPPNTMEIKIKGNMEREILIEYLRRSYFAVDGLWFMMLEKEFSFDEALDIDERVWKILPKIQARKVKELLGISGIGLFDFLKAMKVKLEAEEYEYEVLKEEEGHLQIAINNCPWHNILVKAKREYLAQRISDVICLLELQVWLKEFGDNLAFNMECRKCCGDDICVMNYRKS